MILSCNNVSKSYDGKVILDGLSFFIEDKEKVGLVGINGAGKSTLFRIITGEESADEGNITFSKDKTWAYLSQYQVVDSERTIYEEMLDSKRDLIDMEARLRNIEINMEDADEKTLEEYAALTERFNNNGGLTYKSEISAVLRGLGFDEEEFSRSINTLSGGQKTRVYLSKILISKPDIILLDEPTNHLDINAVEWLENYLNSYTGAVLVISHDRYFLNKIVGRIVEIERGKGTSYKGNYDRYTEEKAKVREIRLKEYINNQREIARQEQVIEKLKSFNREKSIKRAESREKALNKMNRVSKPVELDTEMGLKFNVGSMSGKDVLEVSGISKAFGDNVLFNNVSFNITRGDRLGIIGGNGTGKTTLLKIINDFEKEDAGSIKIGANVKIAYYDQEQQQLNEDNMLFDEISDYMPEMTNTEIRNILAGFLFTGDDVFKYIRDLSGGERARISLIKLMLSDANFIILDEPTNHLDIDSKGVLENALKNYEGTVLFVSHDRYFINRVADRIIELKDHKIKIYGGNYDYYLEKKDETGSICEAGSLDSSRVVGTGVGGIAGTDSISKEERTVGVSESDAKLNWLKDKEEQARKRKTEKRLKEIEEGIQKGEEKAAKLNEEMAKPEIACNIAELTKLNKELEEVNEELEVLYEEWEEIEEEM